jgi:RNA polymerase sigma-70 factor (ECF subfamily)
MLQVEAAPSPRGVPVEETSYDDIYREHFAFVWRNVRRLGVPESLADDAVQDVFVVVHRRLSEFEGRSTLRTWLFGILVRVARDYRRSRARQDNKVQALARSETEGTPTPADLAARREAARIIEELLEQIDEEKREVFVLVELEQMSVADVAEALALNVNTAHARLRAARQQFEAAAARFRAKERK